MLLWSKRVTTTVTDPRFKPGNVRPARPINCHGCKAVSCCCVTVNQVPVTEDRNVRGSLLLCQQQANNACAQLSQQLGDR
jgi:hypothetical protein